MSAQIFSIRSGTLTSTAILAAALRERFPVQIGETAGQIRIGFVDGFLVDVQFHQARLEVQRQGGAVADRLFEAVAAHVAARVFLGAEGIEGVAVTPVDGRAGQAKQEGVRQGGAHLHPQVAFLGAVGFVHQGDDVLAVVQHAVGLAKFEDGGDDDLAGVLPQQGFEFVAAFGLDQVGDVGGIEGGADLGVQVDAVHHDQHGRVVQGSLQAQLLGGEDHQQRLARALEVPDQALAGIAGQHALDDLVGAIVLLVAADDLEPAFFLVGGEQGEVGQDVQDDVRAQQ